MTITHIYSKSPVDQFRDAIAQRGIIPPSAIENDGKLHRFSSNGKRGDDAGWYVFHDGEVPAGAFGDFRTGQTVSYWVANIGRALTDKEQRDFRQKQDEIRAARAADKELLQGEAKIKATLVMADTKPSDGNHPYLLKKNIKAYGITEWKDPNVSIGFSKKSGKPYLRIGSKDRKVNLIFSVDLDEIPSEEICKRWKDILVIPMQDETGEIQSLQLISKNGDKKFLYGGKMQGCFFTIGDLHNNETILIVEGYATAASIHEATGYPVVVAYNAGNLMAVAKAIRAQKPKASIFLCADDDYATKGNPGITKATEATDAIGGKVLVPDFGSKRPEGATDFNDMAAHLGKAAVIKFFDNQLSERRSTMTSNNRGNIFIARPANSNAAVPTGIPGRDSTEESEQPVETHPKPRKVQPIRPEPEPVAKPKAHFSDDEFKIIQKIWENVPRKAAYHSEAGYHLVVDEKRKVIVTKDRIEFAQKPRHRADEAYAAACEHARQFWNGQMEVHGDTEHKIKAWAYASAYGLQVMNFTPSNNELIEANKIAEKLRKNIQPIFGRPAFGKPQNAWPKARP